MSGCLIHNILCPVSHIRSRNLLQTTDSVNQSAKAVKPHGRKSVKLIAELVWQKCKSKQCLNVSFRIFCVSSNAFSPKTYEGLTTLSTIVQRQFYIRTNQSNVSFKISCAAAYILAAKSHERKSVNVSVKPVRHKFKLKQCLIWNILCCGLYIAFETSWKTVNCSVKLVWHEC